MKMKKLFAGMLASMLIMPATAQEPVVINGSLINWYYYGKDYTGSTSGDSWNQQSAGSGAWIDDEGVAHATGDANYGLMSFTLNPGATKPLLPEWNIRNTVLYSNTGGVYTGDAYYSFFMSETGWENGMDGEYGSESYVVKVRKWTWDGVDETTGLYKNVKYQQVATMTTQPIDLTYDPMNDIVYGIFYDGNTYKFGTLDMETFKVTNISREGIIYGAPQCIAINSKGEIYAIDASGYVYTVNKTDGTLTTIGNVGFKSQDKRMSATFDFRTDKLYWIGFMNNGKKSADTSGTDNTMTIEEGGRDTGLYEVSTTNGVATLIGKTDFVDVEILYDDQGAIVGANTNKYGKMQMTGIYVENSFTKLNKDLRVLLKKYPTQMKVGDRGSVTVNVKNIGLNTIRGSKYVVNLYVGNELAGTINNTDDDEIYTRDLDKSTSQDYTFYFTANKAGNVEIYAEVVYADDEQQANNRTTVTSIIVLSGKTLPNVTLAGVQSNGVLNLSWTDPKGHICDGAEDYAAFSYDGLNDWTMIDGDGGYTQKPNNQFGTVDFPNWNTPKAFIVMEPYAAGLGPDHNLGGEKWLAHSGKQYFAGFYSAVPDAGEVDNNDYMVSPLLSGEAQTISFWAKGYRGTEATGYQTEMAFNETLEVLYTTDADNLDPTTYTIIKETFKVNDKAWEQYLAELPAGAKHFALHRNSAKREYTEYEGATVEVPETGSFVMMIDDIEFNVAAMTVTGYKVYKNGTLLTTLDASTTTYTARRIEDSDTFTVKTVYGDSESADSNPISIDILNDIRQVVNASSDVNGTAIYNLRGQRVQSMSQPGLYIIKQGNTSRKVIVK